MSRTAGVKMRQVVDWSAALWAGLVASTIFLLLNLFFVPALVGGNGWITLRYTASLVMGSGVLPPPATFDAGVLIVALLTHYVLSIALSLLLAFIIHRWGLIVGFVGGALFGLALYFIHFYTVTLLFPWFFAVRSLPLLLSYAIFGAVAGGIYETLEVEEFVPVE